MKLYVGNLPWSVDDKALKELFASYGDIEEAVLIKDKYSGRSKGFGFITFAEDTAAQKAVEEMHQKEIEGRALTVSEARPMVSRDDAPRNDDRRNSEPSEAPMADPSAIEQEVEDSIEEEAPEIADDNSEAETVEEEIDSVEEAKEDSESDNPAVEEAVEAEETTEAKTE